jgi:hypothetical protein
MTQRGQKGSGFQAMAAEATGANFGRERRETGGASGDTTALEWASPGVSLRKRILTGVGIALVAALFLFIAWYENASMLLSTLIGLVFIGCFVWYLRIVAPAPYILRLDEAGLSRTERGGDAQIIPWSGVARIKEEVFKSGTSVSFALYKRVGERNVARSFVVYRDDIPRFDDFLAAVRARLPEGVEWRRETVHE